MQVIQAVESDGVFEDIGMVAGMEGVSIGEHGSTLAAFVYTRSMTSSPNSVLTHGVARDLSVLAFDAYGTLLDVYSVAQAADRAFPGRGEQVARVWRDKQVDYSRLRALGGPDRYVSFWQITQDALTAVDRLLQLQMTVAQREALLAAYAELKAYPEVVDALGRLRATGRPVCVLSNGNPEMLSQALQAAGLQGVFDAVLSVEPLRTFKVHPDTYGLVMKRFGVPAQQVCLVSSNAWDVCGARWAGLQAYWVNRQQAPMEVLGVEPSAQGKTLADLVTWLEGGHGA
ncbi:MAG: hypothetical protein RL483_1138 [Pseudomonadota bacterium]